MSSLDQLLQQGMAHHSAGRLSEAEALYRQVLAQDPNHADALHLLGVIAHETRHETDAFTLISRAIAINPNNPPYHNNLGEVHRAFDRFAEAERCYRKAISLDSTYASAWANLSIALRHLGRLDESIAAAERAVALSPNDVASLVRLGECLLNPDPDRAWAILTRALEIDPNLPAAHSHLGVLAARRGQFSQAIASAQRAVEIAPTHPHALANLSFVLGESGQAQAAAEAARRAIEVRPGFGPAYAHLARALDAMGRIEEAEAMDARAAELEPAAVQNWINLGVAHAKVGHVDRAIAAFRRAIAMEPDRAEAHFNLGMALLTIGNFPEGWREFEWRWKHPPFAAKHSRKLSRPWTGQPLSAGQSLLLLSEQGMGDTIHFIRYAPILAQGGARIILACPRMLIPLMQSVPGLSSVIDLEGPHPNCDYQVHLMSVPFLVNTTLESIPASVPYLSAPADKILHWKERVSVFGGLRVGICWAGNPNHPQDRLRSIDSALLAPLAAIRGVTFFSLQKHLPGPPPPLPMIDFMAEFQNFSDTALMANLDLVISVDTAVAHLAGAMARPVWTLLPVGPDWRWMLDRSDCPWYPTMRLFRQPAALDWASVIDMVSRSLSTGHFPSRI
jgi:tetratricopeptide (TPR) repeat protein